MKTIVVFRKFKKEGDIIALFPYEDCDDQGNCTSYQHYGQHGAADYSYCIRITKPASPKEYGPLKKELENIGYELEVKKRIVRK